MSVNKQAIKNGDVIDRFWRREVEYCFSDSYTYSMNVLYYKCLNEFNHTCRTPVARFNGEILELVAVVEHHLQPAYTTLSKLANFDKVEVRFLEKIEVGQ